MIDRYAGLAFFGLLFLLAVQGLRKLLFRKPPPRAQRPHGLVRTQSTSPGAAGGRRQTRTLSDVHNDQHRDRE